MMRIVLILLLLLFKAHAIEECLFRGVKYKLKSKSDCSKLTSFVTNFREGHIYLVLASPYVKNPASLFGHNFILVTPRSKNIIGGFTFSFEANDNSSNKIEYFFKGLTGGFEGNYHIRPTYNTIKLYNNFEDRNLYIFPLKLDQEKREHLLAKMFIYSKTQKPLYYFLDKNCAFFLYKFLNSNAKEDYLFFSPLDTLLYMRDSIDFGHVEVIPSIKNEIKNIKAKDKTLSDAYKNAKYQIYLKYRGKDDNYKQSLLNLNRLALKKKQKIPEYKENYNESILRGYSYFSAGINTNLKKSISTAIVSNKYFETNSISKLTLLKIDFNNFKNNETRFELLGIDTKTPFESHFRDLSWEMQIRHLASEYLNVYSSDILFALGMSTPIFKNFLITARGVVQISHTNNDNSAHVYPKFEFEYSHAKLSLSGIYSKEYFKDAFMLKAEYFLKNNFSLNFKYKKNASYKEDISTELALAF